MLECTLVDPVVDQPPILTSGGKIWQIYPTFAGRCTPCILTSSGQEWQFQVSIVTAHISRLTCRSTPINDI